MDNCMEIAGAGFLKAVCLSVNQAAALMH